MLLGFLVTSGSSWSVRAAVDLSITVGTIGLSPNTPGQTVDLFIANTGDTAFKTQGLTLRFQIDDGLGGGNAPILTMVDAVNGTPWVGNLLGSQNNQTTQSEFWDVRLFSDFLGGQYAELGANSVTKLATATFDTTGLTSGTWDFRLASFTLNPNPGDTKYNLFGSGIEFFPTVNNGQISVTPVPEPVHLALPIFGSLAVLIGGARRWWRRKTSAG